MVNEVMQWTVLVVLGVLMLGSLRQVALMLPPTVRATPSGPPTGRRAPRHLLEDLRGVVANGRLEHGATVAFLTEDCVGCQKLLGEIQSAERKPNGRPLVLVAHRPSAQFRSALEETGLPTISADDALWEQCSVTSTPLVVGVDERGRVTAKEVTHRVNDVAPAQL